MILKNGEKIYYCLYYCTKIYPLVGNKAIFNHRMVIMTKKKKRKKEVDKDQTCSCESLCGSGMGPGPGGRAVGDLGGDWPGGEFGEWGDELRFACGCGLWW